MEIQKLFAEIGRMHLEIMQLNEQLAAAQAELAALKKASKSTEQEAAK